MQIWNVLAELKRLKPDVNVMQLSGGGYHAAVLTEDMEIWNWGRNYSGELGRSVTHAGGAVPGRIDPASLPSNIAKISCGFNHTLLLTSSGEVWSWGDNSLGQLGRIVASGGYTSVNIGKIGTPLPADIVDIGAGLTTSYAVTSGGQVWAWGENCSSFSGLCSLLGRTGDNGTESYVNIVRLTGLSATIKYVAVAMYGAFGITAAGAVWSWGANMYGLLGRIVGNPTSSSTNIGQIGSPLPSVVQSIHAGRNNAAALTSNGSVYTWGSNVSGILGRVASMGSTTVNNVGQIDTQILPLGIIDVKMDAGFMLALAAVGKVFSWGLNDYGQLGRIVASGDTTSVNIGQVAASAPTNVQLLAINTDASYVSTTDKEIWDWGGNTNGGYKLGRGTSAASGSPSATNIGKVVFNA
jgi:alpha-tubulin suppressor-like RCC1 family protein